MSTIDDYNVLETYAGAAKNEGIKLSLASKTVFKSYIHYLTHRYTESEPLKLIPGYYWVWGFNKIPNVNLANKSTLKWDDISRWCVNEKQNNTFIPFGSLSNATIKTISSKTGQDSSISVNEIFNFPASAYIFSSAYSISGDSYVKSDYTYKGYDYNIGNPFSWNESSGIFWNDSKLDSSGFNRDHWVTNYSFSSGYNNIEYKLHNIDDIYLPEDTTVMSSTTSRFILNGAYKKIDAIVITFSKEKIPVVYCELHNSCRQVKGYLDLEWSPDGIITVE